MKRYLHLGDTKIDASEFLSKIYTRLKIRVISEFTAFLMNMLTEYDERVKFLKNPEKKVIFL